MYWLYKLLKFLLEARKRHSSISGGGFFFGGVHLSDCVCLKRHLPLLAKFCLNNGRLPYPLGEFIPQGVAGDPRSPHGHIWAAELISVYGMGVCLARAPQKW